jgi:hypothetical protein
MLADGAQTLADNMDAYASSTITYKRGSNTATLLATIGSPEVEVDTEEQLGLASKAIVFIVTVANLPSFVGGDPQVNDQIIYNGTTYKTFPFEGPFVWEKSDPQGIRIRIYATEV